MLWSDPPEGPPEELRRAQARLRRAGAVLAIALLVVMLLLVWRPGPP